MKTNRLVSLVVTLALASGLSVLLAIASFQVAGAGSLVVTTTSDSGSGSLRQAILDAVPGDSITFDLAYPATITLTTGQLLITESLTIVGPGPQLLSISGGGTSRIFDVSNPGGPGVITVTISGLTLRDGFHDHGSALHSDENLFIEDVIFADNAVDGFEPCGGAVYVRENSPIFKNVIFERNSSTFKGGGMCTSWASPIMINTIFRGNTAAVFGGGMFNGRGSPTLVNVLFYGNSAELGGAMASRECSVDLDNVTLGGNLAQQGGGLYNYPSNLSIQNSILWGNRATVSGHQIVHTLGGGAVISYSDIEGSGGSGPGWNPELGTDGGGNLDVDPLFSGPISAAVAPTTTGDYHVAGHSLVVNSGNNDLLPSVAATDLDGRLRLYDGMVDMGVYEAQPVLSMTKSAVPVADVDYHGVVTYSIVVTNLGVLPATDLLVTDTLPSQVTFARWIVQPPDSQVVANTLTWTGTLTSGEVVTFSFAVTHTGTYRDVVTNTAWYSQAVGAGHAQAVFTVSDPPVLSIAKAVTPATAVESRTPVTYTILLHNAGPSDATGLSIHDPLPSEVAFARWIRQPPGAQVVAGVVAWEGTVTAGEGITFTFVATHTGSYNDLVTNTVYYSHLVSSGHADAVFAVKGAPALSISKFVTLTTDVKYHDPVTYSISLKNTGPSDARQVTLRDVLPPEVTFGGWITQPSGAQLEDGVIRWAGTLTASRALTFTFVAVHTGRLGDVVTNEVTFSHAITSGNAVATFTVEAGVRVYLPLVVK